MNDVMDMVFWQVTRLVRLDCRKIVVAVNCTAGLHRSVTAAMAAQVLLGDSFKHGRDIPHGKVALFVPAVVEASFHVFVQIRVLGLVCMKLFIRFVCSY